MSASELAAVAAARHRAVRAIRVIAITDARRFGDPVARIAEIARACPPGSIAFQIREPDLDGADLLALAHRAVDAARPFSAPVFVNDRLDVAVLADADGVHLPEAGLPLPDALALAPTLAIGCSRHSSFTALAAALAGAHLVQLGPCFPSPGKTPIGTAALATRLPAHLVAVGGIVDTSTALAAITAGASAVAVIRAAWSPAGPATLASLVATVSSALPAASPRAR